MLVWNVSANWSVNVNTIFNQISNFTSTVNNPNRVILYSSVETLAHSLVSFAAGDADEFLDAAGIAQSFGVLHVLGDDLVQCAADGSYRVVRHGLAGRACGSRGPTAGGVIVAATAATAW